MGFEEAFNQLKDYIFRVVGLKNIKKFFPHGLKIVELNRTFVVY